jgi:hypothetical protein
MAVRPSVQVEVRVPEACERTAVSSAAAVRSEPEAVRAPASAEPAERRVVPREAAEPRAVPEAARAAVPVEVAADPEGQILAAVRGARVPEERRGVWAEWAAGAEPAAPTPPGLARI